MTYFEINTQVSGMTQSDQGYIETEKGILDGHILFRLHLLRYHFNFDCCESTEENPEIKKVKIKTEYKSYRLRFGIMLNLNLN